MGERDRLLNSKVSIKRELPVNFSESDREDFGQAVQYETYDSYLLSVGPARVSWQSVIYRHGVVDSKSLYSADRWKYYQTRHLAKQLFLGRTRALNKFENYLLATDQESSGHFHWFTEVTPRLWQIKSRAKDFVLLLPDTPYVSTIGLESLELLGFAFKDIVLMREDEFFSVANLYHITKLSRTGQMHDPIMNELRKAFVGNVKGGKHRIYISRQNAARRKVLNEDELIKMLSGHGFEVFTGVGMGLRDQITLFSECEIVVGIHGAGLTNCLFMNPGKVIELKRKEPNHGYWHLADALGHDYYYYHGVPDTEESLIGQGCNLTIPVADFENSIVKNL